MNIQDPLAKTEIERALAVGTPKRGRRWLGRAMWLTVLVAACAGLAWYFWPSTGAGAVSYATAPATRGALTVLVTATGTVQPTNQVEVSSELSGIVRTVNVDFNSPVKVGQPLAELDTVTLRAQIARARAVLAAAEARVKEAEATVAETERNMERVETLVKKGASSVQSQDTAIAARDRGLAALASAKADVEVAKADLTLKETDLTKACICSPIDGVVLSRAVDPGQTVASSLQAPVLFTLADDLRKMQLQVDVDEADVGQVKAGQKATFTVDAYPGRRFPATIEDVRFAAETVEGVVTYKAILTVDNSDLLLRPGMTATADITVDERTDALTVPNAALRFSPPAAESRGGGGGLLSALMPRGPRVAGGGRRAGGQTQAPKHKVYVLRDGQPQAVEVEIGATDGSSSEIKSGALEAGDKVIVGLRTAGRRRGGE